MRLIPIGLSLLSFLSSAIQYAQDKIALSTRSLIEAIFWVVMFIAMGTGSRK